MIGLFIQFNEACAALQLTGIVADDYWRSVEIHLVPWVLVFWFPIQTFCDFILVPASTPTIRFTIIFLLWLIIIVFIFLCCKQKKETDTSRKSNKGQHKFVSTWIGKTSFFSIIPSCYNNHNTKNNSSRLWHWLGLYGAPKVRTNEHPIVCEGGIYVYERIYTVWFHYSDFCYPSNACSSSFIFSRYYLELFQCEFQAVCSQIKRERRQWTDVLGLFPNFFAIVRPCKINTFSI